MEVISLKSHSCVVEEPRSRTHVLAPSQMLLLTAFKIHNSLTAGAGSQGYHLRGSGPDTPPGSSCTR